MDSSNAEKAAWEWAKQSFSGFPGVYTGYSIFMAGRASRDAEVAELTAAIQAVRDLADKAEHGALRWADPLPVPEWVPRVRAVLSEPSAVLEDRDRENRAAGWDEGERHESEYLSEWGQFCPGEHCNPYRGDNR